MNSLVTTAHEVMYYEQFGDYCPCSKKRKLSNVGPFKMTMKGGECLSMNVPQGLTDLGQISLIMR